MNLFDEFTFVLDTSIFHAIRGTQSLSTALFLNSEMSIFEQLASAFGQIQVFSIPTFHLARDQNGDSASRCAPNFPNADLLLGFLNFADAKQSSYR